MGSGLSDQPVDKTDYPNVSSANATSYGHSGEGHSYPSPPGF